MKLERELGVGLVALHAVGQPHRDEPRGVALGDELVDGQPAEAPGERGVLAAADAEHEARARRWCGGTSLRKSIRARTCSAGSMTGLTLSSAMILACRSRMPRRYRRMFRGRNTGRTPARPIAAVATALR